MSMFSEHNRIKDRIGRIELRLFFFKGTKAFLDERSYASHFTPFSQMSKERHAVPKAFYFWMQPSFTWIMDGVRGLNGVVVPAVRLQKDFMFIFSLFSNYFFRMTARIIHIKIMKEVYFQGALNSVSFISFSKHVLSYLLRFQHFSSTARRES